MQRYQLDDQREFWEQVRAMDTQNEQFYFESSLGCFEPIHDLETLTQHRGELFIHWHLDALVYDWLNTNLDPDQPAPDGPTKNIQVFDSSLTEIQFIELCKQVAAMEGTPCK